MADPVERRTPEQITAESAIFEALERWDCTPHVVMAPAAANMERAERVAAALRGANLIADPDAVPLAHHQQMLNAFSTRVTIAEDEAAALRARLDVARQAAAVVAQSNVGGVFGRYNHVAVATLLAALEETEEADR